MEYGQITTDKTERMIIATKKNTWQYVGNKLNH